MGKGRIFHSMEERERETGLKHPFAQPVIIYGMQRPVPSKKNPEDKKDAEAPQNQASSTSDTAEQQKRPEKPIGTAQKPTRDLEEMRKTREAQKAISREAQGALKRASLKEDS